MDASKIASNQAFEASQDASRALEVTFCVIQNAEMLWNAKQQARDVSEFAMHDARQAAGVIFYSLSLTLELSFPDSFALYLNVIFVHTHLKQKKIQRKLRTPWKKSVLWLLLERHVNVHPAHLSLQTNVSKWQREKYD